MQNQSGFEKKRKKKPFLLKSVLKRAETAKSGEVLLAKLHRLRKSVKRFS